MRSHRQKLERIDIDELFSSPVNRGMLSFLERPPEEAQARLREKQKVDAADATRVQPGGELPPLTGPSLQSVSSSSQDTVESLSSAVMMSPSGKSREGELLARSSTYVSEPPVKSSPALACQDPSRASLGTPFLDQVNDRESSPATSVHPSDDSHSEVNSPPGGLITPGGSLPSGESSYGLHSSSADETTPRGNSPVSSLGREHSRHEFTQGVTQSEGNSSINSSSTQKTRREDPAEQSRRGVAYPVGKLRRGAVRNPYFLLSGVTRAPEPENTVRGTSRVETIDGSIIGRRQKVRRAVVAQDGHSSGEQLLYQAMWNAASVETPETRLISIGYSGMSALCKLEKSNCKKNVQGLLQKLALEIAEPHQSVNSTGTTYRLFSYKEILRRREAAGLIWVIRTSGVRFVNPPGELPPGLGGNSPGGRRGNFPVGRVGNSESPPGGDSPMTPVGKSPTHLEREEIGKQSNSKSSSEDIHQLCTFARSHIPEFDDDACTLLWNKCREAAPDCTAAEVIYSFELKLRQLFNERARSIGNPVGLMIWSVPKMFEGPNALYLERRRAKAEEAARADEALAQFEQNRARWQTLLNDPLTTDEDKQLYRKLLGH
jgi:hypothetical protein